MRNVILDLIHDLTVARIAQTVAVNRSHLTVDPAKAAHLTVARTIADIAQLHRRRLHVVLFLLHLGVKISIEQ